MRSFCFCYFLLVKWVNQSRWRSPKFLPCIKANPIIIPQIALINDMLFYTVGNLTIRAEFQNWIVARSTRPSLVVRTVGHLLTGSLIFTGSKSCFLEGQVKATLTLQRLQPCIPLKGRSLVHLTTKQIVSLMAVCLIHMYGCCFAFQKKNHDCLNSIHVQK